MALFTLVVVGGVGLGPVATGWIEQNPHLEWRWIQWIQMMYAHLFSSEDVQIQDANGCR